MIDAQQAAFHYTLLLLGFSIVFLILFWAIVFGMQHKKASEVRERINDLIYADTWIDAEEFLQLRQEGPPFKSQGYYSSDHEFVGVYILHNITKDMYYVGQAKKVLTRVSKHLTGHGNGDVYADFKYGDKFLVNVIPLVNSGYASIDDLERDTIERFDAFNSGYNRTRGNRR